MLFGGAQFPASGAESLVYVRHCGGRRYPTRKPSPARYARERTADTAQGLLLVHCEDIERAKKVSRFHCRNLN